MQITKFKTSLIVHTKEEKLITRQVWHLTRRISIKYNLMSTLRLIIYSSGCYFFIFNEFDE